MHRPSHPVAAAACTAALLVGCAMSAPADLTPDIDPTLPSVDAGSHPVPDRPSNDGADAASDAGASADGDSGAKSAFAGDAAGPGADAAPAVPKPAAGEVLVTEIMYSTFTPEPASEWVELYSAAASPRSLSGLTLKDGGGRTHVIGAGVVIAPGAYVVLARSKVAATAAKVPAASIVYEYGAGLPDNAGIVLANGATGGFMLLDGTTMLVSVPYGPWFSQSGGSSIQLKALDASKESTGAGWCLSLNAWTTGSEKGTPGSGSDCP